MIAVLSPATNAFAAPPPVIGNDGDYTYDRSWSTSISEPPVGFLVPSSIVVAPDGSLYGIANYSSGSSQSVVHYTATGELIAAWPAQNGGSPTGLALDAAGNAVVLEIGGDGTSRAVTTYDGTGAVLSTTSLPPAEASSAGLAISPDGATLYVSEWPFAGGFTIAAYDATGAIAAPVITIPDFGAGYAAFNLNITSDGRLSALGYVQTPAFAQKIASVDPDGTDLTIRDTPDTATYFGQVTVGPDDRLYHVNQDGDSVITITDANGTVLRSIPRTALAPFDGNVIGVAAAEDGTVYLTGYFFDGTGETVGGIMALIPLTSPDLAGATSSPLACEPFSFAIQASGNPPPTYYEVTAGTLPPGLRLDADTGVVSGTPIGPGGTSIVEITGYNGVTPTEATTTNATATFQFDVALNTFTTTALTVTGDPAPGSALSATMSPWTPEPETLTYQWYRDAVAIPDATGADYTVASADQGHVLHVAATGASPCYADATAESAPVTVAAPTPPAPPSPGPDSGSGTAGGDGTIAETGFDVSGATPFMVGAFALLFVGALMLTTRRFADRRARR